MSDSPQRVGPWRRGAPKAEDGSPKWKESQCRAVLRGKLLRIDKKRKLSTTIKAKNNHHFYKIKERIKTLWIKMYSINCSSKS